MLDPTGFAISTAASFQGTPAVAWNGSDFLVVWTDLRSGPGGDIYGSRVSSAGSAVDPAGIAISTATSTQNLASLSSNGTDFLVVWQDSRLSSASDIYGSRVSSAGSVVDPAGIAISTAANTETVPAVARNGTDFLVVWQDFRSVTTADIYRRVSDAGSVVDPAGILVSPAANDQLTPALTWNGTDVLVVFDGFGSGSRDIYGARVSASGSVLDATGILISTAANTQLSPAVAWNGTDFLVVWSDRRSGTPAQADIYGSRVSATGTVLDTTGIAISTAANFQGTPTVAWNGTDYLVVWEDTRSNPSYVDIYGARVSAGGRVLDPAGIPISTAANNQSRRRWLGTAPTTSWCGRTSARELQLRHLRRAGKRPGAVLDPAGIPISTAANSQAGPASRGTARTTWWCGGITIGQLPRHLRGPGQRRGSVLDPAGFPISTAANTQLAPAVGSWTGNFLVAWQDRRWGTDNDIFGTGVSAGGVVQQPAGIPRSPPPPVIRTRRMSPCVTTSSSSGATAAPAPVTTCTARASAPPASWKTRPGSWSPPRRPMRVPRQSPAGRVRTGGSRSRPLLARRAVWSPTGLRAQH